jgi:hypothetical protein
MAFADLTPIGYAASRAVLAHSARSRSMLPLLRIEPAMQLAVHQIGLRCLGTEKESAQTIPVSICCCNVCACHFCQRVSHTLLVGSLDQRCGRCHVS